MGKSSLFIPCLQISDPEFLCNVICLEVTKKNSIEKNFPSQMTAKQNIN